MSPRLASACLAVTLGAPSPASAQDLGADLDRYLSAEYVMNGAFVGVGAANLSVGAWALTREDPFTQGMAPPLLAVGGVQLTVGAVYLALTPGLGRRSHARLALDPEGYRREERARIEGVIGLFPWFLAADGAALLAGAVSFGVGVANDDDYVTGVGAGLLVSAPIQLALDAITLVFAKRHHGGLSVRAAPGGLSLRW